MTHEQALKDILASSMGYSSWIGKTPAERELINAISMTVKKVEEALGMSGFPDNVDLIVSHYKKRGYTSTRLFPGEYVLMLNPKTMDKIRVYENGDVWKSDRKTGAYVHVKVPPIKSVDTKKT
jgi:hypothetical protein